MFLSSRFFSEKKRNGKAGLVRHRTQEQEAAEEGDKDRQQCEVIAAEPAKINS